MARFSRRGETGRSRHQVAFLDPFGTHLPWATIEQLAATNSFEILINFPLQMAIQRLIPKEGEIDQEWHGHFDEYF